jgi:ABC-type multidrug transport system ATPase subunit
VTGEVVVAGGHVPPSLVQDLLARAKNRSFEKYLARMTLVRVRSFRNKTVTFDFPVTAIIGPNGGGKTTVLGAAAIAYKEVRPRLYFAKSGRFDESMQNWSIEYEIIDRSLSGSQPLRRTASFRRAKWNRDAPSRTTHVFGVHRTVPANERVELQRCISNRFTVSDDRISLVDEAVAREIGHILGKDVRGFSIIPVGPKDKFSLLAGITPEQTGYSEFHFGAGESSIIRMVTNIEASPDGALILIEEIENGLHPVATSRMVEYLIRVASRKRCQVIFTTHSDDALEPLPPEAIWAVVQGELYQGKLSTRALRAITGQVDARLAIFVEDEFAGDWVKMILRKRGANLALHAMQVHAMQGDSIAVSATKHHNSNPAVPKEFPAICIVDGDSLQHEYPDERVFQLPGAVPEAYVFDGVVARLDRCLGQLAEALLVGYDRQEDAERVIKEVEFTNTDRHLVFREIGKQLGLIPEKTVRDAFLSIWVDQYADEADVLLSKVQDWLPLD